MDGLSDKDKEAYLTITKKVGELNMYYKQLGIPHENLVDELEEVFYSRRDELISTEPRRPLKSREELIEECKQRMPDWDNFNDERKKMHLELALDEDHADAYCEHPGILCPCYGKEYDEFGGNWSHEIESNGIKTKICDNCFQKLNDEKN